MGTTNNENYSFLYQLCNIQAVLKTVFYTHQLRVSDLCEDILPQANTQNCIAPKTVNFIF